jgi:hypothetical protein
MELLDRVDQTWRPWSEALLSRPPPAATSGREHRLETVTGIARLVDRYVHPEDVQLYLCDTGRPVGTARPRASVGPATTALLQHHITNGSPDGTDNSPHHCGTYRAPERAIFQEIAVDGSELFAEQDAVVGEALGPRRQLDPGRAQPSSRKDRDHH